MGEKIYKKGESFETAKAFDRHVLWANDDTVFYAYAAGDKGIGYASSSPEDFVILPQPQRPGLKVGDIAKLRHSNGKARFTIKFIIDNDALVKGDDGTVKIIGLDSLEPVNWNITRIDWTDDTTWVVTITGTGKIPDWVGDTDHPLS